MNDTETFVITFAGTTDRITITDTLGRDGQDIIEQIVFDDGTTWTIDDVEAGLPATAAPSPLTSTATVSNSSRAPTPMCASTSTVMATARMPAGSAPMRPPNDQGNRTAPAALTPFAQLFG